MEEEKAFYCRDGKVARSLNELATILQDMPQDEFSHHVNEYKNDFANWIEHVIGDPDLAGTIRKANSKQEILFSINERIMRMQISRGLREYTERREPVYAPPAEAVSPQAYPQEQQAVQEVFQASAQEQMPTQAPQAAQQARQPQEIQQQNADKAAGEPKKREAHVSREQDYREHPYKYFTLREFVLGVLLGFVLGFVVSKLIFGLIG